MITMLSIIESSLHPNFEALYAEADITNRYVNSMRKAITFLKDTQPDYIVAEFFYGYANNYAGVNISNLDVLLYSLQKYSADTRVIVIVDKSERQYVDALNEILPLHAVLQHPVTETQMKSLLGKEN